MMEDVNWMDKLEMCVCVCVCVCLCVYVCASVFVHVRLHLQQNSFNYLHKKKSNEAIHL